MLNDTIIANIADEYANAPMLSIYGYEPTVIYGRWLNGSVWIRSHGGYRRLDDDEYRRAVFATGEPVRV